MFQVCIAGFLIVSSLLLSADGRAIVSNLAEYECKRVERREQHGYDIVKMPLMIDEGECSFVNGSGNKFEEVCELNNTNDCTKCVPQDYEQQQFNNRSGPFSLEIIRSCMEVDAEEIATQSCQKASKIVYFFPNSVYETSVNLGRCVGLCETQNGLENTCSPVKTTRRSIRGPNGGISVEIINECSCADTKCYRKTHMESVWDYQDGTRVAKDIDVGQCVGACSGVMIPGTCIFTLPNGKCWRYNPSKQAKCVPLTHSLEAFTDRNMNTKTIPTITECGCSSA